MFLRLSPVAALALAAVACDMRDPMSGSQPMDVASSRFGVPDLIVHPGGSIQAAVDRADPGALIFVAPGLYAEPILIAKSDITLVGLGSEVDAAEEAKVIIANPGGEENGIKVTEAGAGVHLVNLTVRDFEENGVLLYGVNGFTLEKIVAEDNGEYGLFPVGSSNGVIDRCVASGHSDTGIYVGQSEDVVIRNSTAFGNVNGFEIENSSNIEAADNNAFGNTAGFLVVLLPGLPVSASSNILLARNQARDNNLPNFADGGFEQFVPPGSGVLIVGTDATTVQDNIVTNNSFVGVGLANTGVLAELAGVPLGDLEPFPDGARILHNEVTGNGGAQPIPFIPPGVDLLWDGTGADNCWSGNTFETSLNLDLLGGMPSPTLPACS